MSFFLAENLFILRSCTVRARSARTVHGGFGGVSRRQNPLLKMVQDLSDPNFKILSTGIGLDWLTDKISFLFRQRRNKRQFLSESVWQ
jgi:hypothetical protein